MNLNNNKIKLIRNLSWEEVFLFWYKNEGENENWQNLARERGYNSWADWRIKGYTQRFKCHEANWALYQLDDPTAIISEFYGGPFRTWRDEYYDNKDTKSFSELAGLKKIQENPTIKSMLDDFPINKIIICLEVKDKIFTIEGSHRFCALALMEKMGRKLNDKLIIAIGKSKLDKLPVAGKNTLKQA